jgi:hypothetical protein
METIEIEVYSFDELDDRAKERARAWWRDGLDYPWWSESKASIYAFAGHFNVTVNDYQLGGYRDNYIRTDASNAHFRGVKLADIDRDYMPTGYCLDCTLWQSFYDDFKKTGDAKYAFEQALEQAIIDIQNDVDYYYSDESVDENIQGNEYKFLANGEFWE